MEVPCEEGYFMEECPTGSGGDDSDTFGSPLGCCVVKPCEYAVYWRHVQAEEGELCKEVTQIQVVGGDFTLRDWQRR